MQTFTIAVQNPLTDPLTVNTTDDNARIVMMGNQRIVSLRAAISLINAGTTTETINFSLANGSTINLGTGLETLTRDFFIDGPGSDVLTIQRSQAAGTPNFGIFSILNQWQVTIRNVTIANGATEFGAGIHNAGTLNLSNVVLRGNNASTSGGALYNMSGASVAIWECLLRTNSATSYGGGIWNGGTMYIQHYTEISDCNGQRGGGVFNSDSGQLTIDTGSSIRNNYASDYGGGIANWGTLIMTDAFLDLNRAEIRGGGLFNGMTNSPSDATLTNVSIQGNRTLNTTTGVGGGIYANRGTVELAGGCTLRDNTAGLTGGGNGAALGNGALLQSGVNDIDDDIVNDPTL